MRNLFAAFRLPIVVTLAALAIASLAGMPQAKAALNATDPMPEHVAESTDCHEWDTAIRAAPPSLMVEIIPDENLPGVVATVERAIGYSLGKVTRAFAVFMAPYIIVGIERGGCVLDPIVLEPK